MKLSLLILLILGILILQYFLSKTQSKWPGLILPLCVLILSLLTIAVIPFRTSTTFSTETYNDEGVLIESTIEEGPDEIIAPLGEVVVQFILAFLFANTPNIILLSIYYVVRKAKRKSELHQMTLQDL